ncbi:MAG: ATP-binding cassette domain-containing protein [Desulfobacterales bacterium]|nr:ATP-binding cassette domain-containing protein [Desulfobacterales bacterium]
MDGLPNKVDLERGPNPIVELAGVSKVYPGSSGLWGARADSVTALETMDLTLFRGEIFGLVGQSGSGKTTTGRLLVKLEEPSSGEIRLNGQCINKLRGKALQRFRSKVQMIFQDPYQSLNPHLSIADTISEPLKVHGLGNSRERREKVLHILDLVGLKPSRDFYHRYPHQLSGGQRQRVAIARAIVLDPEFIVADEPTSMLDATIAIQLLQLLVRIRKELGMTFLFITHNLAAANYLCDRIAVIHEGKIVETGPAREVIRNPQHPYTRKLIQVQPGFTFTRK